MLFEDFIQKIVLPQITSLKRPGMVIDRSDEGTTIIVRCGKNATVYGEFSGKWKWSVYVDNPDSSGYVDDVAKFQKDLSIAADFVQLHRNLEWYRLDPKTHDVIMPPDGYENVHTRHCSPRDCKYGDEDCPVVLGTKPGQPDQFLAEQIADEYVYQEMYERGTENEDDLNYYGER